MLREGKLEEDIPTIILIEIGYDPRLKNHICNKLLYTALIILVSVGYCTKTQHSLES